MNHRASFSTPRAFSTPRLGRAAVLALALAFTLACFANQQPSTLTHTSQRAVRAPESLPLDVVTYTWTFFNYGRHIRITGQVRNNSAQVQEAVTLALTLEDERGEAVLKGQTHVFPAYLPPGGEGSFELVGLAISAGRNLPAGRLMTAAQTSAR